jgi:hypothetical protein
MNLATQVVTVIEHRIELSLATYDLRVFTDNFISERVAKPAQRMDGLLRGLIHDLRIAREGYHGCQKLKGTVRDILGWCGRPARLDYSPIDSQMSQLERHDPMLQAMQRTFVGQEGGWR